MNLGELTPDLKVLIDAEITEQVPGGPGGSQPIRVIGPCSIDYADFHTDGTIIDLFDTTAGDVLVNAWYDPATAVNWDDSGPSSILFAETPTVHGNQNYDFALDDLTPGGGSTPPDMSTADGIQSSDHYVASATTLIAQETFAGGTYKARNRDGANDGANGHIDMYFLVATPTAPVLTP